jgi:hypothetical protein
VKPSANIVGFSARVRIALDGPDAAAGVHVQACWRGDLRLFGEERDLQPRIEGAGMVLASSSLT